MYPRLAQTHYVLEDDLEPPGDPSTSTSPVLELQACTTGRDLSSLGGQTVGFEDGEQAVYQRSYIPT